MPHPFTTPFWEAVHRSKDPTTCTVLAEDAAALVGLAIAAVGIALSHGLDMPALDGAAPVPIGFLLAGAATLPTWESRGLLTGEGIRAETAQAIREIALVQPGVREVGRVPCMYVGPDDVLVPMDLDLDAGTDIAQAAAAIGKVERQVRARCPVIRRLVIEAGSAPLQQRWSRPDAVRLPAETAAGVAHAQSLPAPWQTKASIALSGPTHRRRPARRRPLAFRWHTLEAATARRRAPKCPAHRRCPTGQGC